MEKPGKVFIARCIFTGSILLGLNGCIANNPRENNGIEASLDCLQDGVTLNLRYPSSYSNTPVWVGFSDNDIPSHEIYMDPKKDRAGQLALRFHVGGANISDIRISNKRTYLVKTYRRLDDPTLRPQLDEEPEGPFYSDSGKIKDEPTITYDNDGGLIPSSFSSPIDKPSRGTITFYRPGESDVLARNLLSCNQGSPKSKNFNSLLLFL